MQTVEHTRAWIEEKTKIEIPPNKRNPKPRDRKTKHQEYRRGIKALKVMMGEDDWDKGGRPTAANQVFAWRAENPDGRKIDCERSTGLSRHTVLKWWDFVPEAEPVMIEGDQEAAIHRAMLELLDEESE